VSKQASRKASMAQDTEMKPVSDEHDGKTELFVQGMSFDTTEQGVRGVFEKFGTLTKCKHF